MRVTLSLSIVLLTSCLATAQTVTIAPLSQTAYCRGAQLEFEYQTSGTFNSDNRFVLQMSDKDGSFASFTNLATDLKQTGRFAIKADTVGDHYRFRVVGTSPYIVSEDNGQDIRFLSYPNPEAQVWPPNENRVEYVGLVGAPLRFISQRVADDTVLWSFTSDAVPVTTTDPNPTVTFTTAGKKTATLSATNVAGCRTSTTTSIVIGECHPRIPKGARIVTGFESGTLSDSAVLIKTGATFTARLGGPFFVEPGGVIVIGDGQSHSLTYLMNGSSVRIEPDGAAAYFVLGSDVVWTDGSDLHDTIRCNDLSFDYSQLTSSVVAAIGTTGKLAADADGTISWSGEQPISIEVLDLLGRRVLATSLDRANPLDVCEFAHGAYIVRSTNNETPAIRIVR